MWVSLSVTRLAWNYKLHPLAENLDMRLNETYDVGTGRRPTVSTDDDPVLELDGHNRCLDNSPLPNQSLRPCDDIRKTYAEVDLA